MIYIMDDELRYRQKYLKYKQKYAQLIQEQSGGHPMAKCASFEEDKLKFETHSTEYYQNNKKFTTCKKNYLDFYFETKRNSIPSCNKILQKQKDNIPLTIKDLQSLAIVQRELWILEYVHNSLQPNLDDIWDKIEAYDLSGLVKQLATTKDDIAKMFTQP